MDYLSRKKKDDSQKTEKPELKVNFTTFCNYVFRKLSQDEISRIIDKFLTNEVLTVLRDRELSQSINAFFKNNLNISETSRNAYLHRNTLIYRIEKIIRVTGLDVRKFDDAMTFKLISMIYNQLYLKMGK